MNCPRCVWNGGAAASPYRGELRQGAVVALVPERHAQGGVEVARCPSCRGVFVTNEALVAIENKGRTKRDKSRRGAVHRAWDPPTEAISCPSCFSETTRREWSIGTLVFVDVCIECRGVWLDSGELEILGG